MLDQLKLLICSENPIIALETRDEAQAIGLVRKAADDMALPLFEWSLTGYNLLAQGTSSDSNGPSVLVETLLGALGALAVLLFVFASFLAFLPLLIAAVSIVSTFVVVLLLTYVTDMSFIVQFLIALVGLGVAVGLAQKFCEVSGDRLRTCP